MGLLNGRSAVVTGGGRGIGRGHCLHLAKQGASVVVNDIDLEEARKVVAEIAEQGGKASTNDSDISTREGAQALISQCVDEFGGIHAVVNNAGNVRDRSFLKMTDEEFMGVVRVHQAGTFMCSQEAALRMRDQGTGGAIVNTVSAAHFGNFGQTNYAGSKGAIASMTYTWALELARYGIRVNAISPSGTTRMSATYKGPDGKDVDLPFNDPTQNGAFVAFLCSDAAAWISGQIFGTGSDRVAILEQPRYGTAIHKDGGWSTEDLAEKFEGYFKSKLEPIGIMKPPYPFYDGVKPPSK
ncbi:MAG: SDR family NAD(P)-dependent oxidoreductase [Deltaproteobacteria bacterium]|nr:SDR family NAD(P)-dependent oxidoreductase [Deltaproteobacteria bacterium]MBW2383462.1 SDR family NAD(P)-dependent oxidoreductase [Deltaproteobacteria bacterium]MBW2696835.1 SDR family NAD(P)-dependent oxidoreductase [Deltaproteobacteria bacterium]